MINELGLMQTPNRIASSTDEAVENAAEIGFPLVVRPSYVLGGRAMEIVYNETDLKYYMETAVSVSNDAPVLLDRFLDDMKRDCRRGDNREALYCVGQFVDRCSNFYTLNRARFRIDRNRRPDVLQVTAQDLVAVFVPV